MNNKQCPSEAELLEFVDRDLPPEKLELVSDHLAVCSTCAQRVAALKELIEDIAAPLPDSTLDTAEHAAAVMKRLDQPLGEQRSRRWIPWVGVLAAAAAALVLVVARRAPGPDASPGEFLARGGSSKPSLSRDVGVRLYTQGQTLTALPAGSRIAKNAALTAGLRNLGSERAYLLLFAVDSKQVVHWIAPAYTQAGTDPQAAPVPPSQSERLLPSVVVFDDLALGPLRVVAVITRRPTHVSEVESLRPPALGQRQLMQRFPRGDIRQFQLEVAAEAKP